MDYPSLTPRVAAGPQEQPDTGQLEIIDVAENLVQQIEKIFQVCAQIISLKLRSSHWRIQGAESFDTAVPSVGPSIREIQDPPLVWFELS